MCSLLTLSVARLTSSRTQQSPLSNCDCHQWMEMVFAWPLCWAGDGSLWLDWTENNVETSFLSATLLPTSSVPLLFISLPASWGHIDSEVNYQVMVMCLPLSAFRKPTTFCHLALLGTLCLPWSLWHSLIHLCKSPSEEPCQPCTLTSVLFGFQSELCN